MNWRRLGGELLLLVVLAAIFTGVLALAQLAVYGHVSW